LSAGFGPLTLLGWNREPRRLWIVLSNGMLRGPHGEMMTRDEFDAALPRKGTVVVLPDNGRDPVY
jgi:hypothetical protein